MGAGRAITAYASAASATVAASGPAFMFVMDNWEENGSLPNPVAKPTTPDKEAGVRIDPPPSKPIATGVIPSATATAEPDEEPPE